MLRRKIRDRSIALGTAAVDAIWKRTLRPKDDFTVFLTPNVQPGALVAVLRPEVFWRKLALMEKVRALATQDWWPTEEEKAIEGEVCLLEDLFGDDDDCGLDLLKVNGWIGRTVWNFSCLTQQDETRANALEVNAAALQSQYVGLVSVPRLNLVLKKRAPALWTLFYPMAVKVPVRTVRYFVEIHARFAFNEIRRSTHPRADEIISFLYELLSLQQKTAFAIFRFFELSFENMQSKGDSLLTKHELDSLVYAEAAIGHLKATVEKILGLLGAVFGAKDLESRKNHKARLNVLRQAIPEQVFATFYAELLMTMVDSENLQSLNNIRTGLLHKRGVADFQPHSYVGVEGRLTPHAKILALLHEQHSKNSAALVAALAMLADDLVRRLPPAGNREDTFRELRDLMCAVPLSKRGS